MNPENMEPVVLEAPTHRERTWVYPWLGVGFGLASGIFIAHPLAMLAYDFHECMMMGTTCDVGGAILKSFELHMWPMMLIFAIFGGVAWGLIGLFFQRFRENRLRLDTLHQEFELQVATLRHHYKNLAIGIDGFSNRIKRKLADMDVTLRRCFEEGNCPIYEALHKDYEAIDHNVAILEDAAQRLTHTLGQELLFLKALTSSSLPAVPSDFYPFLAHCVDDLVGLRFREKQIQVEINGQPPEECRETLVFPFEPHTMEVILQNVLTNAMKYGDLIRIRVADLGAGLRVEVRDNGPGMDIREFRRNLAVSTERREADSTHLGLRVSIHLLGKIGGRLSAWSRPGEGTVFIIDLPKHLPTTMS